MNGFASSLQLDPRASAEHARRAAIDDLVTPARRSVRISKWIAFLALAALTGIIGFMPLASGVVARGQLIVDGDRKVIQHAEGGMISELLVGEGDLVEAGDVLVRLDQVQADAAADTVNTQIDNLLAEEAVRQAEMSNASKVSFPAALTERTNIARVRASIEAQENAFRTRRLLADSQRQQLSEQADQINQRIASTQAEQAAAEEQAGLLSEELDGLKTLLEKGLTQRPRVLAVERTLSETRGRIASLSGELGRLTAELAETNTQHAQIDIDRRAKAADALRTVRSELSELVGRQATTSDTLRRTEITAPTSGVVMDVQINTIGGIIGPGEPIMDIVPNGQAIVVLARITPNEADDIRKGMKAIVRFDAGGARSAPRLEGIVRSSSADALRDERSGETYFEVRVDVPASEAEKAPEELMAPGLPAEVLIQTGEQTPFRYIVNPIQSAMFKAMRDQ